MKEPILRYFYEKIVCVLALESRTDYTRRAVVRSGSGAIFTVLASELTSVPRGPAMLQKQAD